MGMIPMGKRRKKSSVPIKVQGWDLALNHSAFVELTNGILSDFWYVTESVESAKRGKGKAERIPKAKTGDRALDHLLRLYFWKQWICKHIERTKPDFIGIEDYSFSSTQGAHAKGELGCLGRLIPLEAGIKIRLHDPKSIKMFVAHNGKAEKNEIEDSVFRRWGVDFCFYNPKCKPGKKQNTATSEDLSDAFGIARFTWTEYQLRNGLIELKSLHEKEIRAFNRVTKAFPVNLLGRGWLCLPGHTNK